MGIETIVAAALYGLSFWYNVFNHIDEGSRNKADLSSSRSFYNSLRINVGGTVRTADPVDFGGALIIDGGIHFGMTSNVIVGLSLVEVWNGPLAQGSTQAGTSSLTGGSLRFYRGPQAGEGLFLRFDGGYLRSSQVTSTDGTVGTTHTGSPGVGFGMGVSRAIGNGIWGDFGLIVVAQISNPITISSGIIGFGFLF